MRITFSRRTVTAVLVATAFVGSIAVPLQAEARSRQHSVSRSGPAGRSVERDASVQAGPGYRDASRMQQGPNGGTREVERGYDRATVLRVWRMLDRAEYKRRQAPPGVKIGTRAFGRDRRYPITNGYTNLIK